MEPKNRRSVFSVVFFVGILVFTLFSFSLAREAIEIENGWPGRFIWSGAALIILGVFYSLAWLFFGYSKGSKYFFVLLSFVSALCLFVFLDWQKSSFWLVFFVSLICFCFAGHQALKEKEASFRIHLSRILSLALLWFFTGLAFVVASFYYFYQAKLPLESFKVPPNLTNFTISFLDDFLGSGKLGRTITLDISIDDYLKKSLLSEGGISKEHLNDPRISALINSEISKSRDELNREYNLHLTGQEKISQVLASFITAKINEILGPYRKYIPLALAFGLFIALRAIAFIYVNIVVGIVWVLLKLLMLFGLVKIEKVMVEKEVIRI